jgi:hypothetical protein
MPGRPLLLLLMDEKTVGLRCTVFFVSVGVYW